MGYLLQYLRTQDHWEWTGTQFHRLRSPEALPEQILHNSQASYNQNRRRQAFRLNLAFDRYDTGSVWPLPLSKRDLCLTLSQKLQIPKGRTKMWSWGSAV